LKFGERRPVERQPLSGRDHRESVSSAPTRHNSPYADL
jgi:hypothetical protein